MFQSMFSPYRQDTRQLCDDRNMIWVPSLNFTNNLHIVVFPTNCHKQSVIFIVSFLSQPIRIGSLLIDSLRQTKENLRQFLNGLPRFLLK